MSSSTAATPPEARYISVDEVEYEPANGFAKTLRKHLLTTDRVQIHQTLIRGRGEAEGYGVSTANRAAYVLAGSAILKHAAPTEPDVQVGKGHLILIPSGADLGAQLSLLSDELVLLEVTRATSAPASDSTAQIRVVDPEAVQPYEPAGHAKTRNRCLFVDEHMEIIEGLIERGGGAERHAHRNNEQLLYVLAGAGVPLLIHYPMGAPHGTGGGVPEPLELLVIYSPPLGESHNALA